MALMKDPLSPRGIVSAHALVAKPKAPARAQGWVAAQGRTAPGVAWQCFVSRSAGRRLLPTSSALATLCGPLCGVNTAVGLSGHMTQSAPYSILTAYHSELNVRVVGGDLRAHGTGYRVAL
jgi:hypothetical protein